MFADVVSFISCACVCILMFSKYRKWGERVHRVYCTYRDDVPFAGVYVREHGNVHHLSSLPQAMGIRNGVSSRMQVRFISKTIA